ncbi:MAG TPA: DinB family protein [Puia sp.]|jgi:hypothetical protein|nr:DinB family protein [Puia sp.]
MSLSDWATARLQNQHKTISQLTKDYTEKQLQLRVNPDKWSAFENIVHLCAYQPTFIHRIERMGKEENPLFERYVADSDSLFHAYLKLSLPQLISITNSDRLVILNTLQSLSLEQWNRTGTHPKYGALKMAQWVEFFLLHESHHLWVVMQLAYSIV